MGGSGLGGRWLRWCTMEERKSAVDFWERGGWRKRVEMEGVCDENDDDEELKEDRSGVLSND